MPPEDRPQDEQEADRESYEAWLREQGEGKAMTNDQQLIVAGQELPSHQEEQPRGPLADLRRGAMGLPPDAMQTALAMFKERRDTFRDWLRSQLVPGNHFGYPPGCLPKKGADGTFQFFDNRANGGRGDWVSAPQWVPKPSLYKAGADFVCDLMGVRPTFEADMAAHQQMGSPKDTFVFVCRLVSIEAAGQVMGEGRGVRTVGQKGGDANNAIKMAQKCAKVDAVLNTYGLSDLFTQDVEGDIPAQPHDNPAVNEEAPVNVPERAQRAERTVTAEMVKSLLARWKDLNPLPIQSTPTNWAAYCQRYAGREFNPTKINQWTWADLEKVEHAIQESLL